MDLKVICLSASLSASCYLCGPTFSQSKFIQKYRIFNNVLLDHKVVNITMHLSHTHIYAYTSTAASDTPHMKYRHRQTDRWIERERELQTLHIISYNKHTEKSFITCKQHILPHPYPVLLPCSKSATVLSK